MQRVCRDIPRNCEILAGSCDHVGSIMCHREGIKYAVDWVAQKKNRFAIRLGDAVEAICTDDNRYNAPPKEHKDKEEAIPLDQAKDAINLYKPIGKKIVAWLGGNHERKLARFGNVAKYMADEIGSPYGTESCRIILTSDGKPMFNIFAMHGGKIFTSHAKDFEQREANKKAALKLYLQEQMGDCALMLCGHAHKIIIVEPSQIPYLVDSPSGVKGRYLKGMSQTGYIPPDQRWYACCGSARKSRLDGYDDYAQNYPISDLGYVKITIEDGKIQRLEPFLI
jgi:predicted phosphodiesterase